jgi:hypothetical protein
MGKLKLSVDPDKDARHARTHTTTLTSTTSSTSSPSYEGPATKIDRCLSRWRRRACFNVGARTRLSVSEGQREKQALYKYTSRVEAVLRARVSDSSNRQLKPLLPSSWHGGVRARLERGEAGARLWKRRVLHLA